MGRNRGERREAIERFHSFPGSAWERTEREAQVDSHLLFIAYMELLQIIST